MTSIPKPSIGRIVHVHTDGELRPAIVTGAAGLRVNARVFGEEGDSTVYLLPHLSEVGEDKAHWTWPPRTP